MFISIIISCSYCLHVFYVVYFSFVVVVNYIYVHLFFSVPRSAGSTTAAGMRRPTPPRDVVDQGPVAGSDEGNICFSKFCFVLMFSI